MTPVEYFKLQAKNLLRDYKTQSSYIDTVDGNSYYQYNPKYFDIDSIFLNYDWDEENFSLMKAQHLIALIVGFSKWDDFLNAPKAKQELAKLLFDNQDKIHLDDWQMYIAGAALDNKTTFDDDDKLEIFKQIFLNVDGHRSPFADYRLNVKRV